MRQLRCEIAGLPGQNLDIRLLSVGNSQGGFRQTKVMAELIALFGGRRRPLGAYAVAREAVSEHVCMRVDARPLTLKRSLQHSRIQGASCGALITNYRRDPSRTNRFSPLSGGVGGFSVSRKILCRCCL